MNLRTKFALVLLPPILAALFGLGWWHYLTTAAEIKKTNELYLETLLDGFIESALERRYTILQENGLNKISSFVHQYRQEVFKEAERIAKKHGVHVLIYDANGDIQHATKGHAAPQHPLGLQKLLRQLNQTAPHKGLGHLQRPDSEGGGLLYLQRPFHPWNWRILLHVGDNRLVHAVTEIRQNTLLVATLLTTAILALLYIMLRRLVMHPVDQLREAAQRIAQHERMVRIPLHGEDEMGVLARAIESMSHAIDDYQEHLQTQRNRFQTLLAANPDLISLKNRVGIYQVVNPAFCAFVGRDKEAIIGQDDARLFPIKQALRINQEDQQVLESGQPSEREEEAIDQDNNPLWLHVVRTPITDDRGQITGILTTIRNISARKIAEEALRIAHEGLEQEVTQRTEALTESETRLRIITESLPAVVWMSDPKLTRMHFVSPAYERIWGKPRENLFQNPQSLLESIHPSDRNFVIKRIANSEGQPWEAEYRILHPDGSVRWIRDQGAAFRGQDHEVQYLIGCSFDVTALKETQRELSSAKQDAEAASHAKSAFLATMSHEIRTPLNGITGMLERLRRSALNEDQNRQVETISKCSIVLMDILNDVLDLSKIEAGQLVLEREPYSPIQILQNLVEVMRPQAQNKGLTLELEIDKQLPETMLGDATRLRQVSLNLIGNAIKFTHQGWVRVHLRQHEKVEDTVWVELSVEDQGIGIAHAKLAKLFDPFTQADSSITRNYGGTGLGLAISKRLVEAMAGAIIVESQEGKGTHFRVTLPLQISDQPITPFTQNDETLTLKPISLLLVEDEMVNQQVATALLQDEGHQVDVAKNGEEAVKLCQEKRYQVILMDLRMPKMDGLTATELIRQEGQNQETPIVALTADVLKSTLDRCLEVGMQQVLTKPIRLVHLNHALAQLGLPLGPPRKSNIRPVEAPLPASVPATTPSQDDPGLKVERLRYLVKSLDADHLQKIVVAFKATADSCLSGMQHALEQGDEGALKHTAHKLAGSASTLGLERVMEQARALEKSTDSASFAAQITQIQKDVDAGFQAIAEETGLTLQTTTNETV
ncbi:ATP-binding protein [Magnetococcus sp. PR-3]|uniref:ATP-binding protein n=1 Tax=Magnetococcus sp. PR-3 TaxID=3120355 RepID=UPI002FCE1418